MRHNLSSPVGAFHPFLFFLLVCAISFLVGLFVWRSLTTPLMERNQDGAALEQKGWRAQ